MILASVLTGCNDPIRSGDGDSGYSGSISGINSATFSEESYVAESAGANSVSRKDTDSDSNVEKSETRKLIRTVDLSAVTKEFEPCVMDIETKIIELGGYVESSNVYYGQEEYSSNRRYTVTARIPDEKTDEFLSSGFAKAHITDISQDIEDVSMKYSDIEARLKTLRTEEERLRVLMEKAEDIDTVLSIEERLSEISYQIESNATQLKYYDNKVSYSTVYAEIKESKTVIETPEAGYFEKLSTEFRNNTDAYVDHLKDISILILSNIVRIIVTVSLVAAAVILIIYLSKKSRKKKEDRKAAMIAKKEAQKKEQEAASQVTEEKKE